MIKVEAEKVDEFAMFLAMAWVQEEEGIDGSTWQFDFGDKVVQVDVRRCVDGVPVCE